MLWRKDLKPRGGGAWAIAPSAAGGGRSEGDIGAAVERSKGSEASPQRISGTANWANAPSAAGGIHT